MTAADLLPLLPLLVLGAAPVLLMLIVAFRRSPTLTAGLTIASFAASFILAIISTRWAPRQVTALVIIDHYALFYIALLSAAGLAVALLSYTYFQRRPGPADEYYLLLLLATLGSAVLAASNHFASFFLGLELLSVSLYAMVAYLRRDAHGLEAGIKYLVLAAASAAFLLFGMALVYAERGTLALPQLLAAAPAGRMGWLMLGGLGLIIVGIAFKLALAPFHLWTPDVYQGAPAPATAFIATVSKGGMFALLLRWFSPLPIDSGGLHWVFFVLAIASMFTGNLLALLQNNLKRILAYSSIANFGYLLVAFLAGGDLAVTAVTFYLIAYFVTTLGAFGVITVLSEGPRELESLQDYEALGWRRPWLAGVLAAMMFSLAGIPVTAGFLGKFYVIAAGARTSLWVLIIILVINSAIGLYYYLRVVVMLYRRPEQPSPAVRRPPPPRSVTGAVALTCLAVLLIWLGVYPGPLIRLIEAMATGI